MRNVTEYLLRRNDVFRQLKVKEVENLLKVSNHRNIVSLHTAWEEDGVLYMLLEPCQSNLKQLPHMTEQDCWAFLVDIVSVSKLIPIFVTSTYVVYLGGVRVIG